jgi:hypothetical protein
MLYTQFYIKEALEDRIVTLHLHWKKYYHITREETINQNSISSEKGMLAQMLKIFSCPLWNPKYYYRVINSPSLSLSNELLFLTLPSLNIHCHTLHSATLASVKQFLPSRCRTKLYIFNFFLRATRLEHLIALYLIFHIILNVNYIF